MKYKTYAENAAEEILAEDGARADYISEAYGPSAIDPEYEAYCDNGDDAEVEADRLAYEKEVETESKEAYEKALAADVAKYGGPVPF